MFRGQRVITYAQRTTDRRINQRGGTTVAVKFLSQEWAEAMTNALNSSEDFKSAASGQSAKLQQVVTDVDGGDVKYYFVLDGGTADISLGEVEGAEATVTQNYDTAAGLQKGEVNAQQAFMQGKLKVSGNMMKLMQLQAVISAIPKAVSDVEVEY
jgi:putative sterol carrier protein